ncbi:MAG: F0F1 ATP synthase subunit delta [Alphaproteobacteria bacterium]|nr:F0F1 ATP synthase subunit delta [Alphaproteobacteria bacterium]
MAAETSIVTGISGRYAVALFEMALDAKALDAVASDLDRIQAMLRESEELRRLVESPVLRRDEQARAMAALLERAGIGELVGRFVGVVAQNRRLFQLRKIISDFRALLARHRGETVAQVTSATPLNPGQLAALKAALKDAVGRDVNIDARVDARLIGGLVVQVGSRMVDASVRSRLENMKVAMKGVA